MSIKCQPQGLCTAVHSAWNTHSSHPQGSFLPFLQAPHLKVTLSISFPWIPFLNGTPISLPSLPITFFRMSKKRWRKDMASRSPEGPGSNYITIQYNHKDGLLLPKVHPGPAGMWWHEPHFSSRSIPLAHKKVISTCVWRIDISREQGLCFPHTVCPVLRVGPTP